MEIGMQQNMESNDWWPLGEVFSSACFVAGGTVAEVRERTRVHGWEVRDSAWVSSVDWNALKGGGVNARLITAEGEELAVHGDGSGGELVASSQSFVIRYPWHLLAVNEQVVGGLNADILQGEVSSSAVIEGNVVIGEGTRLLPGVYIEGNAVIGKNCKIGPNCYIRGNTAIGDGVHIGQAVEIKNSIIGHKSSVGHLGYVGDSILGSGVNFGAGTTTSNLRHDGSNHRTMVGDELLDTGRRKFGTVVGDGVHTGIHTAIYPGRKLGPGVSTLPNETVQRDLK